MSDEAVRKEFEAWFRRKYYTVDPIAEATIWAAWQASRSAAIQECADKLRRMANDESNTLRMWDYRKAADILEKL